jgi:hypothetical protein
MQEPKMIKIWGFAMMAGSILCVLETTTTPPASALDRQIQLTNNTRMAIVEFYASQVGDERWQEEILGQDFLQPGNSLVVNIDDRASHCQYDFKAVFDDGTTLIRRDVNVCKLDQYTISYRPENDAQRLSYSFSFGQLVDGSHLSPHNR